MHDGPNIVTQRGEGRRALDSARVASRNEGSDEVEVVARDNPARTRRHDDEMRAEEQGFFDRMGDEKDLLPGAIPYVDQQLLHLLARQTVKRAERLVHEQDRRVGGERAGNADPLTHAARQFIRRGLCKVL